MRRLFIALVLAAGCGDGEDAPQVPPAEAKPGPKPKPRTTLPDRVKYEQILVAFKGSYVQDGKVVVDTERSKEEARALARSLLDRARSGFDFAALKQEFSDDRDPRSLLARGPYESVRDGVRREGYEIPLRNLHPGLADVVYRLKVGEFGLVEHDERLCPDGWLVVHRVE